MKPLFTFLAIWIAVSALAQDTINLTPPSVWVRVDSSINGATFWKDVSGNGNNLYPSGGQSLPQKGILNFNPCFILGSESTPFKVGYEFTDRTPFTMVTVYQTLDTLDENGIWFASNDGQKSMKLTTQKISTESFSVNYTDTNVVVPIVNTFSSSWSRKSMSQLADTITLCGTDSLDFHGNIAECLIFHHELMASELQKVQSYLCIKYGVTLRRVDYINSKGHIFWNTIDDSLYSNSVAGIGKDSIFGLNQKQSSSTSLKDIITMGALEIDSTNQANSYAINDGDFVVWGNNNGNLAMIQADDTSSGMRLMDRKWLIRATGNTASTIPCYLKVDCQQVDTAYHSLRLVIDRTGDSESITAETESYLPDSLDEAGNLYFYNIHWDTDQSGTDLFTLMGNENIYSSGNPNAQQNVVEADEFHNQFTNSQTLSSTFNLDNRQNGQSPSVANPQTNCATGLDGNLYKIYPNPTNSDFSIDITLSNVRDITVQVFDLQGRIVQEMQSKNQQVYHFHSTTSCSGTYFVSIKTKDENQNLKLLVY